MQNEDLYSPTPGNLTNYTKTYINHQFHKIIMK